MTSDTDDENKIRIIYTTDEEFEEASKGLVVSIEDLEKAAEHERANLHHQGTSGSSDNTGKESRSHVEEEGQEEGEDQGSADQ